VDSHRSYAPDEPDGQWYQRERGYPDLDWERRGGDPRYAQQQPEAAYGQPVYNDQPYSDYHAPEPRAGYQPEGDGRYAVRSDGGPATGRVAPVSPRSSEPLPPMPAAPQLSAQYPADGLPFQSTPTSGLPYLGAGGPGAAPGAGAVSGAGAGPGTMAGDGTEPVRYATEQIDRAALRRSSGEPGQLGDGVYRSRRPGTAIVLVMVTVIFELMALRLLAAALSGHPVQLGGSIASAFLALGLPMFGLGLYGLLSGAAATPGASGRVWLRTPLVYLPVALTLFLAAGLAA
jgi:hypothetical protein